MNKLTAIKRVMNGSDCALIDFSQIGVKYVKYWDRIRPSDKIVEMSLEMFCLLLSFELSHYVNTGWVLLF